MQGPLSVDELLRVGRYWTTVALQSAFKEEVVFLIKGYQFISRSLFLSLQPLPDAYGLICVGGRCEHSSLSYSRRYPVILSGSHPMTKLIIQREYLRLLHAGLTQMAPLFSRWFHILRAQKAICTITLACVVCCRVSAKLKPQILGQLPANRLKPGSTFE